MNVLIARVRVVLPMLGALLILVGSFADVGLLALVGFVVLVVGMACYFVLGTVRAQPVQVQLPVTGRWVALDLVHEPPDRPRPSFGSGPGFRPPSEFPAFGQPVLAPADGVVVRARDRARDHRSRNSWAGIGYLLIEGMVREALGPGRILGNHIVLDLGNGVYAALAHLQRDSARVKAGPGCLATENRSW